MKFSLHKIVLLPLILTPILYLIITLFNLDVGEQFSSPTLLFTLNTMFLTVAGFVVTAISIKSYLTDGSAIFLMLGLASIVGGITALMSGLAATISINFNIAIFNTGFLLSGFLQLFGAIMTLTGSLPTPNTLRKISTIIAYSLVIVFMVSISILVILGYAPVFYDNFKPTLTSQWVLIASIVIFSVSSAIFLLQFFRSKSSVLLWYSIALVMLTLALIGFSTYTVPDGIFNWVARIAVYLGSIYFVATVATNWKTKEYFEQTISTWTEAFRNDQRLYGSLFEKMNTGFVYGRVVTNHAGEIVDWIYHDMNLTAEQIFQKKRQDMIGKKATDVFPFLKNNFDNWFKIYGKAILEGEQKVFENYSEDLQQWYRILAYSPRRLFYVVLFEDVTENKKAEEALKQRTLELEKKETELQKTSIELVEYANQMEELANDRLKQLRDSERLAAIGATAGMVGHDIRNPLQAIIGDIYLTKSEVEELPEGKAKKDIQENLEAIEKNIEYINKIVSDLQDFARPIRPNIKKVNLEPLIMAALQSEQVPKNIKTTYRLAKNVKTIFTDEDLLKRILDNLGLNAIQAMPDGGEVFIDAYNDDGEIVISVKDTGIGIPDNVKPKLFTPMVTTKAKGQGFGLAAVKRMTEALGASISFESEVGKGTKFTIRLAKMTNQQSGLN